MNTLQWDGWWPRIGIDMFDDTTYQPARLM